MNTLTRSALFLTVLALGTASAAVPGAATADGVRAAETAWSAAFVGGDTATLDALLDPDYVSVGKNGQARSRAEIIALASTYAAAHPGSKAAPFPATSTIVVKGKAAIVRHSGSDDVSVDVFHFADGRWRAWFSQHTAIAPPKSPDTP